MKNIKGFTYAPSFVSNVDLCKDSTLVFKILEGMHFQDMRNETEDMRKNTPVRNRN